MSDQVWIELIKELPAILTAFASVAAALAAGVGAVISHRNGQKTDAVSKDLAVNTVLTAAIAPTAAARDDAEPSEVVVVNRDPIPVTEEHRLP